MKRVKILLTKYTHITTFSLYMFVITSVFPPPFSSPVIESKNISLIVRMNAECVGVMNVSRRTPCVCVLSYTTTVLASVSSDV